MSIATIIGLGIQRQREKTKPQGRATSGDVQAVGRTADSAMERVSAFIPSEIIGLYVAGLGIFSPETDTGKWQIFWICFALIPVIMVLNYLIQRKQSQGGLGLWPSLVLFGFAIVAFVAWTAALPSTPFLSIFPDATTIGGWAVIILAVIMYKVAELMGIVP